MRYGRMIITLLLTFSLLVISPAASAADTDDIICQLLNYYQYYQQDSRLDLQRLLQELEAVDAEEAQQWKTLLESWHQANTEIDFNADTLPDNLPDDDSLCIVVMGYQLTSKGKMQDQLVGRLKIALSAAKQYPNAYILVTGGNTASQSSATEAGRMAEWLKARGVSKDRIIQETKSRSTVKNAVYSMEILKSDYPQVKHLAIVTSDYHMIRSHLVFAAQQAYMGGDIIDIVGHACYDTSNSTSVDYSTQAELIAMMVGVDIEDMGKPRLSRITELVLSGNTQLAQGEEPVLTVTAVYNSGITRDITEEAIFTVFDPNIPGTHTIEACYTENNVTTTGTITVEVIADETQAPTEPAAPETEAIPEVTEDAQEKPKSGGSLTGIILALVIGFPILRQEYLRRQRRKNRPRKDMNLE